MLTVRFNDNNHLISIVCQAAAFDALQLALGGGKQVKEYLATINK
jgi:hypothetical protein